MTQELTPATGNHPLRTRGAGRMLYAGGMSSDFAAVLVLALVSSGTVRTPDAVQGASVFPAIGLQVLARWMRRRAWWHVPLRGASPVPVPADLVFWSATALVLTAVAVVQTAAHRGSWSFGAWFLVAAALVAAWVPSADRPHPEPPSVWWTRAVPMLTAAGVVLVLAVLTHQAAAGTAAVVAVVVLGVTVLLRRRARAASTCAPSS